jgi:hypothetical protein
MGNLMVQSVFEKKKIPFLSYKGMSALTAAFERDDILN